LLKPENYQRCQTTSLGRTGTRTINVVKIHAGREKHGSSKEAGAGGDHRFVPTSTMATLSGASILPNNSVMNGLAC
jgi:hypothetical protein